VARSEIPSVDERVDLELYVELLKDNPEWGSVCSPISIYAYGSYGYPA
jgi:hypothetical protein